MYYVLFMEEQQRYNNIEDHQDQILGVRPHNYDWSIMACLVDQQEDGEKACKQTYQQAIIDTFYFNKLSGNSFVHALFPSSYWATIQAQIDQDQCNKGNTYKKKSNQIYTIPRLAYDLNLLHTFLIPSTFPS